MMDFVRRLGPWILVLVWATAATGRALGGSDAPGVQDRRVEVRVTERFADTVYLDRGRTDGLRVDDRVRLLPTGAAPVEAIVESVSANSARARVLPPGEPPAVGSLGEVFVPAERLAPPAPAPRPDPSVTPEPEGPAPTAVPAHPPWQDDGEPWDPDRPLLAEPRGSTPAEREPTVTGRLRLRSDTSTNGDFDVDNSRATAGLDLTASNPFGAGGALDLDAESLWRAYEADVEDDEDLVGRVDELAYSVGGDRERSLGLRVGRFSQRALPRLGRLDGVELRKRDAAGRHFALSLGFVPDLNTSATPLTGDEVQVAAAFEQPLGDPGRGNLTLGLQKTWFEGRSDRDLLLAAIDLHPGRWNLRADLLMDYYASRTATTDAGFEVTEYAVLADRRLGDSVGVGLSAMRFSLPDLLRNELLGPPQEVLAVGPVDRIGARGWWRASDDWRWDLRVDRFEDDEDEGDSYELRATGSDVGLERLGLTVAARASEARFSDQVGLSVDAHLPTGGGSLRAGYSFLRVDPAGLQAGLEDRDQHFFRVGFDTSLTRDWTVGLDVGHVTDEDSEALTVGLRIAARF